MLTQYKREIHLYMGVSKNRGTPKSSILIGFSLINHPLWGTRIFGHIHIYLYDSMLHSASRNLNQSGCLPGMQPRALLIQFSNSEI